MNLILTIIIGAVLFVPLYFLIAAKLWLAGIFYIAVLWFFWALSQKATKAINARLPPQQQPTTPPATRTANRATTLAAMRKR